MFSRRQAGLGAAALAMTPTLVAAQAAPAPVVPAGPGFHRFALGGFTVTVVNDGFARRNIEGLVLNAPPDTVRGVLAESFLPTDHYIGPYNVTFVDTGRQLVMIDAGTGGQLTPTAGRLAANMAAAGLDAARVGLIIVTHCHQDHIHGLTSAEGQAVFPNAEVAISEPEHAWWSDPSNETRSPPGQRVNFANFARRFAPYQGRVRRFAPEGEIAPGFRAVAAHGHSPGHTVVQIADGTAQLLMLADTTHRPELFARQPDYISLFDFDGAAAVASRKRILDRAAADRVRVTGFHFPFPSSGFITREGAGYRFVAADWNA